jgi:hypothetical protein
VNAAKQAPPRSVRMPADLEAWYEAEAEASGLKLNRALVVALERNRARVEYARNRGAIPVATLQAAYLAARGHGKILADDVLRAIIAAAAEAGTL